MNIGEGRFKNMASNFSIVEEGAGFRVEARDCDPARVLLMPYCLVVATPNSEQAVGLFDYPRLVRLVVPRLQGERLQADRGSQPGDSLDVGEKRQAVQSLKEGTHAQWKRLLTRVDPTILSVQRAIFAATLGGSNMVTDPRLYGNHRLVSDILRFRAAAIAAGNIDLLGERLTLRQLGLFRKADPRGIVRPPGKPDAPHPGLGKVFFDPIEYMEDWRALFSCSGQPYRNLNQTLEHLPGRTPADWVCNLTHTRLERPVLDGLELLLWIIYSTLSGSSWNRDEPNAHVFAWARREQILEAMRRIAEYARTPFSANRAHDVYLMAAFLENFPEKHNGNIVGLAEKAVAWTRNELQRQPASTLK